MNSGIKKALGEIGSPSLDSLLLADAQYFSGFGYFTWDMAKDQLEWSDGLFEIFGVSKQEFVPTSQAFFNAVHPDDRSLLQQAIEEAGRNGGAFSCEERIRRPSGEVRYLESRGRLLVDDAGRPQRLVGLCHDVSDDRKSLIALRSQVKGLQLLAEFSARLHSGAFTGIEWGATLKELGEIIDADVYTHFLIGDDDLQLVAGGGLPADLYERLQSIAPGEYVCGRVFAERRAIHLDEETLLEDPDGAELAAIGVRAYYAIPLITNGTCFGTIAFASTKKSRFAAHDQDFIKMTAHVVNAARSREFVDNLRNHEAERFKSAAEVARMVVWEADPKTADFVSVHGFYEELLGYPKSEWLQPGFWVNKMHPDDAKKAITFCQKATARQEDHQFEYRMIRANGEVVWIDDSVKVVCENGETVKLKGTLVDITGRKALEQQLIQSQKMEAVGRLAGGIAHDFNNLLTVINTSCDLLRLNPTTLLKEPATAELISAIQDAGERASRLTDQLLLFSRSSSRMPQNIDVNVILNKATELISRLLGEGIRVEMDLEDNLPPVQIDPIHLEQLIMNLAVNARDAMPNGGQLSVSTKLSISSRTASQSFPEVCLFVKDTGVGMSEEVRAQLFDPFFTTKEIGSGTGLGLAVVFGIVSETGGAIDVDSALGRGTSFTIRFPASDEGINKTAGNINTSVSETGRETILLVEDDAPVRRVACETLRLHGYRVLEARDATAALDSAENNPENIDLLVVDVIMPDHSGPVLVEKLKAYPSCQNMGVVYVSGYPEADIARRGVVCDGNNFLQKPFSVDGLLSKVRKQIDASARSDEP